MERINKKMEQSSIAIIIILSAVILFATEKIPLAMTAILAALAMSFFGIISYTDALIGFGSPTVMMIIGMIIIGNAVFETGLAQVIGDTFLKKVSNNEKKFLVVIIIISAIFSAFMSNTATVALFLPIISTIAAKSKGIITKKNTSMALGFSAVAGGACTVVGSTPQLVAQGILAQTEGVRTMTFFEIGKIGFPLVFVIIIFFVTIGYKLQQKVFDFPEIEDDLIIENGDRKLSKDKKNKMVISGTVLIGCVLAFILELWNVGVIAILGATILIVTRCIDEKKAYKTMDWTTVVIVGGAIGFSKGLDSSGGGRLIADTALNLLGGETATPFGIMVMLTIIAVILGNFMSHTATASMLTPIAIYMAQSVGVDPIVYVITVIISCNNASATPVGTPPITLTLPVGYRFNDYVIVGGALTVLRTIATIILIPIIYGL